MTEFEILKLPIDQNGVTVQSAGAFQFLQWVGNKINGVKAFSADAVELSALIQSPPMSRTMHNDKKIEIVRRLERLNIPLI
jgi:hypothetical protein